MNRHVSLLCSMLVVMGLALAPAYADENEMEVLKKTVSQLTKKVDGLETKVASVEGQVASKPAIAHPGHITGAEGEGGLLHATQDINVGGHMDIQWNNNFRQPPGVTGANTGRIFDTDDGSFTVNAVEIWLENRAEEAGEAGFRVNLAFGEDSGVIAADGFAGDNVDLQEAFVEYIAPLKLFEDNEILPSQIKLMVGRFATLAGAEVIEGPSNWNISRSFMFGLGIPFINQGVRSNFKLWKEFFDVYLGVNNGWDVPVDNNSFKTLELGVGYSPFEKLKMFHALYWGGEVAGTGGQHRILISNVATYNVTEKLALMAEFNWAKQGRVPPLERADWYGIAGYARYQFTDKFAVAYRAEYFIDEESVRGVGAGSDRTFEQTITAEYKLTDNMIARTEFRHDKSRDDNIYNARSYQTTIGAQVLYLI